MDQPPRMTRVLGRSTSFSRSGAGDGVDVPPAEFWSQEGTTLALANALALSSALLALTAGKGGGFWQCDLADRVGCEGKRRTAEGDRCEGVWDEEDGEEGEDEVCSHVSGLVIVVVGHGGLIGAGKAGEG